MNLINANITLLFPAADPGHSKHAGAETAANGSGYLNENSRLLLHCYLLWSPFQRGTTTRTLHTEHPKCTEQSCHLPVSICSCFNTTAQSSYCIDERQSKSSYLDRCPYKPQKNPTGSRTMGMCFSHFLLSHFYVRLLCLKPQL